MLSEIKLKDENCNFAPQKKDNESIVIISFKELSSKQNSKNKR